MQKRLISVISLVLLLAVLVGCKSVNTPQSITIKNEKRIQMEIGDTLELEIEEQGVTVTWSASNDAVYVDRTGRVTACRVGKAAVSASYGELSDTVMVEVVDKATTQKPEIDEDSHVYASSYSEALERSSQGIPSGKATVPDQAPVLSEYRPMKNGKYILNTKANFIDSNTYSVVDAYGDEVFRIYRGGGYITLEEVAAYVYAFGDVPANYISGKNMEPENSIWGEYLRLNHSKFSGDTERYPYEPKLPNISGCGGNLQYYEIDIGTTGTDCDDSFIVKTYNDGESITRGAARIVYGKFDLNGNGIYEFGEHHVFYTYNHYNDFQEYLNYYGGWGEIFGNITGGGELSSKTNYRPTSYISVVREELSKSEPKTSVYYYFYDPKNYYLYVAQIKKTVLILRQSFLYYMFFKRSKTELSVRVATKGRTEIKPSRTVFISVLLSLPESFIISPD